MEKKTTTEIVLQRLIKNERKILASLKAELKAMPKGNLKIRKKGEKMYFSEASNNRERGISGDLERVNLLARKFYLGFAIECEQHKVKSLEKCLAAIAKGIPAKCTQRLRNAGLAEANYMPEELKWRSAAQSCNPYKPEHLRYRSNNGIIVRSKTELVIANRLEHYGITYRYEPPLKLTHQDASFANRDSFSKTIFPDFMILTESGNVVIWEHFGLLDNREYAEKANQKIKEYADLGFKQHTNLICSDEKDIEDNEKLDEIIFKFLLN